MNNIFILALPIFFGLSLSSFSSPEWDKARNILLEAKKYRFPEQNLNYLREKNCLRHHNAFSVKLDIRPNELPRAGNWTWNQSRKCREFAIPNSNKEVIRISKLNICPRRQQPMPTYPWGQKGIKVWFGKILINGQVHTTKVWIERGLEITEPEVPISEVNLPRDDSEPAPEDLEKLLDWELNDFITQCPSCDHCFVTYH